MMMLARPFCASSMCARNLPHASGLRGVGARRAAM